MPSTYFTPTLPATKGFYYRMPISTTLTQDKQPLPQYFHFLTIPYFGVVYPPNDNYAGSMIVKTTQLLPPFHGVDVLSQYEVFVEIKRMTNQEFEL
jgi:hypothetical protein